MEKRNSSSVFDKPMILTGTELRVKPVLTYGLPQRGEAVVWRAWGGVYFQEAVNEEIQRVEEELKILAASPEFPMKILPLATLNAAYRHSGDSPDVKKAVDEASAISRDADRGARRQKG